MNHRKVRLVGFKHRHPPGWHSGSGYVGPSKVIALVCLEYIKGKPVVEAELSDREAHELLSSLAKVVLIQARNRANDPERKEPSW